MSYRAINPSSVGKGVRSNHRTQLNWFRRASVADSVEHWDQEVECGRHIDSFKTFESTARRRTQPQGMGQETI
jgi:hypothetical protein